MREAMVGRRCAAYVALWALASVGCSSQPAGTAGPAPTGDPPPATVTDVRPVSVAYAESSLPLRDLPAAAGAALQVRHTTRAKPIPSRYEPLAFDPVLQKDAPRLGMPPATVDFLGQGTTLEMCTFPNPPPSCTTTGLPPDTNGAAGPNHYVQTVNGGIAVWNKAGTILEAPKLLNLLWTGYTGTNPGNGCATQNDGDPVVLYDQLADRWFVAQFSLPNGGNAPPSFQCVAVSKTGDPTGAYWLYDFSYSHALNDYPKFGVWPDAYYATFNMFGARGYDGADLCAYDRVSMLQGSPATQQCFLQASQNVFGALPASVDGQVRPPRGAPGIFVELGEDSKGNFNNTLDLWTLHVDWTTPANSKLGGPTSIPVSAYTPTCGANATPCIPEPSPGLKLDPLSDRLMFRLNYRNFGTYESLVVNHSVTAGTKGGVRWYEIRSPIAAPALFQQGTYSPNDANWRWGGSIGQDQAADLALGFSASSATMKPAIGWTGRLATDPMGTMGQGETLLDTGTGVETGTPPSRWGDYSDLTVDPSDDCTFWYTQELYDTNGDITWDTRIAAFKFPSCAANDFSIAVAPAAQAVMPGGQVAYTVTTASTKGAAETLALNVQDLPSGVTGAFNPASVTAGSSSALTLTASASAPLVNGVTFTVIGTAPSAVHPATAQVTVGTCVPLTMCPAPDNCGTIGDGCGGMLSCGMCPAGQPCTNNVCVVPPMDAGTDSGAGDSGVARDSGTGDSATGADSGTNDSGVARDSGLADSSARVDAGAVDSSSPSSEGGGSDGGAGGSGDSGGCGCRTAPGSGSTGALPSLGLLALAGAVVRRRRSTRVHVGRARDRWTRTSA